MRVVLACVLGLGACGGGNPVLDGGSLDGGSFDGGASDAQAFDSASFDAARLDAPTVDGGTDATVAEELAYDDGTSEVAGIPDIGAPGGQVAVRFTPHAYPARLLSARFFVPIGFDPTTEFRVRVYAPDASPDAGMMTPGAELLGAMLTAAATAGDQWVSVDLSPYAIVVASGDFFVAMEWLTVPGPTFMGVSQQIGEDEDGTPDLRSWYHNTTEADWIALNSFPNPVDAMIRATVSLP